MLYKEWIEKEWTLKGGLITPSIASRILNISTARIAQMQIEKKLHPHKDPKGKTLLAYTEVMKIAEEKRNI